MAVELSRGELLAWVNDLTNLNVPKVESLGTGSALCLIIHSIYGDVPVHKINFKAIHEYEYVHNFKILQEAFTRHRIERTIPVDRLIKLKFQDNLEFLQWIKKFWDLNYDSSNGLPEMTAAVPAKKQQQLSDENRKPVSKAAVVNKSMPNVRPAGNNANANVLIQQSSSSSSMRNTATAANTILNTNIAANTAAMASSNTTNNLQLAALTKTITELKLSVDEMEKERDFYFNKLRDIEILTQKVVDPSISTSLFFKQITEILYTTEEGFEIPHETTATTSTTAAAIEDVTMNHTDSLVA